MGSFSRHAFVAALLNTLLVAVTCKKIAIVGGGFSGISTAYHLSKRGYDDITIYQKNTDRVGGYATQIKNANVTQDVATYAITPSYWKFRQATVDEFNMNWCIFKADMVIYDYDNPSNSDAHLEDSIEYYYKLMKEILGTENPGEVAMELLKQTAKYFALWTELMGMTPDPKNLMRTSRLFPPKPPYAKRLILAQPTLAFMESEGLDLIVPFMRLVTDTQAYGAIENTPLLYYMTWVPPTFLLQAMDVEVPCGPDTGFQQLADDLLQSIGSAVTVKYDHEVSRIERGGEGVNPTITFAKGGSTSEYEQVVSTNKLARDPFRERVVSPYTAEEEAAEETHLELEIFGGAYRGLRQTSLWGSQVLLIDGAVVDVGGTDRTFYVCVDHEWVDVPLSGASYNDDPDYIIRTCSLFFYADRDNMQTVVLTTEEKTQMVLDNLKRWETTDWDPLMTRSYKGYFQRWDGDGIINGYPWTLEESSGLGGVYTVNSATCGFESVGNIFDCAEYIADKVVADSAAVQKASASSACSACKTCRKGKKKNPHRGTARKVKRKYVRKKLDM